MTKLIQTIVDGLGVGSMRAARARHLADLRRDASHQLRPRRAHHRRRLRLVLLLPARRELVVDAVRHHRQRRAGLGGDRTGGVRWVRNASPFTLLLTSFALERLSRVVADLRLSQAGAFPKPAWVFNQFKVAGVSAEVMDVVTIAVTAATLALTAVVFKRTLFGISVRCWKTSTLPG